MGPDGALVDACCRALSWALTARRCLLFPEGRPKQVGVEPRWRPEAPAVPRVDSALAAATAEEVAARVAKKVARNKKKNTARSGRRQRKREAMNSGGDKKGGSDVAPPPKASYGVDVGSSRASCATIGGKNAKRPPRRFGRPFTGGGGRRQRE